MLKITAIRSGWCLMALALSACSFMQQPAAPAETGGSNTDTATAGTAAADNPYGSAPYTPPAGNSVAYPSDNNATAAPPYPATAGGSYVPNYAPVDITASTYTVQTGDTVYNIAKRFQISQDNLRSWNNIVDNTVKLGSVLRVKPEGYVAPPNTVRSTTVTTTATTTAPAATPSPAPAAVATTVTTSQTVKNGSSRTVGGIEWQRPTTSTNILTPFSNDSKGIDYAGNAGQPIFAAAAGKVVYSGSGLRGYGNLIIIQHNQTYLTAYGHNQNLLVKEGQQVKRGQQIATMGNTDAKRNQLHFELRENGTPQNPSRFLP
ncbi:M23 family metallopeptidase [Neisseriaceae bacterium ESL0693]|nr:M23 family metallopeptidase [Neisseriaceae bacterium ESL0693]